MLVILFVLSYFHISVILDVYHILYMGYIGCLSYFIYGLYWMFIIFYIWVILDVYHILYMGYIGCLSYFIYGLYWLFIICISCLTISPNSVLIPEITIYYVYQ